MPSCHPYAPRFVLLGFLICSGIAAAAATPVQTEPAPSMLQQMVGRWTVAQRMWPRAEAPAIDLPPATAQRRLVGGAFLDEVMTLAPGTKADPFTRTAWFNYNAVNQQYEYASLDTRAPQLMVERSVAGGAADAAPKDAALTLYGGSFVAPRWGDATNAAFRYRLVVGVVVHDRQRVQLYLTPLAAGHPAEFLAFEYVYTRQH